MQYPTRDQPPAHQQYAPSEIYMPEQAQTFVPLQPQPVLAQQIVIYPNRTLAIFRASICIIAALFIIGIFFVALATNGPLQPSDIGPMVVTLIVVLIGAIFLGWLSWYMGFQQLRSSKPMLVINRDGITVGQAPMLSGFFIAWGDIEAINASRYIYKYFCIVPKNPDQFLARFSSWERFMRRINAMVGSPLYVPQGFLDKPVEEIIQQVYYVYSNELAYYRVQLRS
jgi:uncharacterized membrane protein YidH (DUF202 family)